MSRFFTWASSWASTPSSSGPSRCARSPSVTATTACRGLRPVAKAFKPGWGTTKSRGIGSPADCAIRRTVRCSSGCSPGTEFLRPVHREHDPVREPVAAEVHDDGQPEGQDHPPAPAHHAAEPDQKNRQQRQQKGRLDRVAHVPPAPSFAVTAVAIRPRQPLWTRAGGGKFLARLRPTRRPCASRVARARRAAPCAPTARARRCR